MMNSSECIQIDRSIRRQAAWSDNQALSCAGGELYNLAFTSRNAGHLLGCPRYDCPDHGLTFDGEVTDDDVIDCSIEENIRFRYPLLRESTRPGGLRRYDRAIVLLHGLNERSFAKYLPWAHRLRQQTGTPVVLFPLAFHMNRVLPGWAAEQKDIFLRRSALVDNDGAHRFNATISERLDNHPERFFWAAVQSYLDLRDLTREIRSGHHPHFSRDARVDFLGYSAGGYLSLILLLEDPEGLFTASRAVIFGSGVPTRDLNLLSPLILDSAAETALTRMYVRHIDSLPGTRMKHWFQCHGEGKWVRALSGLKADSALTEQRLRQIGARVLGIANINDNVAPVGAMLNSLQGLRRNTGIRVVEFDLGLHESPFVCEGYGKFGRRLVTEVLDEARYGEAFDEFVRVSAAHLQQ
jgi:pimeloyl-ACP methyl ester carboxylesterase